MAAKGPGGRAGGGPITQYQDYNISRGRKKKTKRQVQWKKFVRKVDKAVKDNDRTHTMVEAPDVKLDVTVGLGAPNTQNAWVLDYSAPEEDLRLSSPGIAGWGVGRFVTELIANKLSATDAAPTAAGSKSRFYTITNSHMTVSIKNVSAVPVHYDIYELIAAQDINNDNILYNTGYKAWLQCLADTNTMDPLTAPTTKLLPSFAGATPYQATTFQKWWKILKKTRVVIAAGQNVNFEIFGGKAKISTVKQNGLWATKGLTKDLIIVSNPTFNSDTAAGVQSTMEWTKTYHIKLPDMQGTQTFYSNGQLV